MTWSPLGVRGSAGVSLAGNLTFNYKIHVFIKHSSIQAFIRHFTPTCHFKPVFREKKLLVIAISSQQLVAYNFICKL